MFSESKKTRTSLEHYGRQKDILCLLRVKNKNISRKMRMSKRHFLFTESKKTRTSLERYGCQKDILCLVRVKKQKHL